MYKKWFSITYLCSITKLAHSTYYYNCKHDTSSKYDPTLLKHVELLHDLDNTWGYRQATLQLEKTYKIKVHENTLRRYRKFKDITAVRYFRTNKSIYAKYDPAFDCKNSAKDLVVTKENQLWNIDITYHILKDNLKSYQFTIKDKKTGKIVNSNYSTKFDMSLVLDTIEDALNLSDIEDLTLHCDHGSHFIAKDFIKLLQTYNVKLSMSRLGSPEDNQSIECFFGWLKNTLVPRKTKLTFDEMKLKIESRIFTHNYINLNKDKETRSTWGDDPLSILVMQ